MQPIFTVGIDVLDSCQGSVLSHPGLLGLPTGIPGYLLCLPGSYLFQRLGDMGEFQAPRGVSTDGGDGGEAGGGQFWFSLKTPEHFLPLYAEPNYFYDLLFTSSDFSQNFLSITFFFSLTKKVATLLGFSLLFS